VGQQKNRLEKFLKEHPFCCFCGGAEHATSKDHLPPRTVFRDKKWPEGYEFPACEKCNNGSAENDALVGMMSRFGPGDDSRDPEREDSKKLIQAFKERHPDVAKEMILRTNEVRQVFRKEKLEKPAGLAYAEIPIVRIPKRIINAVEQFSEKLICALHYKHTNRKIVPSKECLKIRWWTNVSLISGKFPTELGSIVRGAVSLKNGNVSLHDQFSYKFGVSDDGMIGAYLATFRKSFAIFGLVAFDPQLLLNAESESTSSELGRAMDDPSVKIITSID